MVEKELLNVDAIGQQNQGHEIERIEGNLIYLKGFEYPYKGIPSIERVEKANGIKQAIRHFKSLKQINLPKASLNTFATEIYYLISNLTGDNHIANCVAFVLEYDSAYRFRLQDLFSETTQGALANRPAREIWRLMRLSRKREQRKTTNTKLIPLFLVTILYAVTHKTKWKEAINQSNFSNLQLDENDRYWCSMKTDYDYMGITIPKIVV